MLDSIRNASVRTLARGAEWKIKNPTSYLQGTGAFNFGLLCGTQAIFLNNNKQIPQKSKNFLVASEVFEGILKVGIFVGLAEGFKQAGKKLVDKGYLYPKSLLENKNEIPKTREVVVKLIEEIKKNTNSAKFKELEKFTEGVKTLSSLTGMIVGLSIIVPVARNFFARKFRDKFLTDKDIKNPMQILQSNNNNNNCNSYFKNLSQNKLYDNFIKTPNRNNIT